MAEHPGKILAIIPAYCEERYIFDIVRALKGQGLDVLVVDDCSMDSTANQAENAGAVVLRHPFNMGYGAALQTGYLYALQNGYRYILQLDADNQHDPLEAGKLLEPVLSGKTDLVIGSRFLGRSYKVPLFRRMGIKWFGLISSLIAGQRITDCTSGYQAMTSQVATLFCTRIFPDDYPDADVLIRLLRLGIRIAEVPVSMRAKKGNKSMHSGLLKQFYYIIKMTLSIFLVIIRKRESDGN